MIKVGFSGAGGTGKGTLLNELRNEISNITFLESNVMKITKNIFPDTKSYSDLNLVKTIIKQFTVANSQIAREETLSNEGISYISERSLFDYLPYSWNAYKNPNENIQKEIVDLSLAYQKQILKAISDNKYDIVFYFPIEFEPQDLEENNWKERDSKERKSTADLLEKWLNDYSYIYSIPVIKITGTTENRKKIFYDTISTYCPHFSPLP